MPNRVGLSRRVRRMRRAGGLSSPPRTSAARRGARKPATASKRVSARTISGLWLESLKLRTGESGATSAAFSRSNPRTACSREGCTWRDRARSGAMILRRKGSWGPKRRMMSSPRNRSGSEASSAASVRPSARRVGPAGWAPYHCSAHGAPSGSRPSISGMAVVEPQS